MTSEAVFIQVGALADGFAPHGNLLATASLPAGENFTFYVAGSEPQQLVIEDEQTLSWNGKRAPWRATALRPDILFIDFLDPERDNASISAVCNLTQRNATLVYGQLPDEAAARLDAFDQRLAQFTQRTDTGLDALRQHLGEETRKARAELGL